MKTVPTFKAEIYIGYREQYTDVVHTHEELIDICKEYCDTVGLCVAIEPVHFVYTKGDEYGAKITLINYPRFPKESKDILLTAHEIGTILMKSFKQYRISIVTNDNTYMLENDELPEQDTK